MSKSPARLNDAVLNTAHGNGKIITANNSNSVTFGGLPVACAGDLAQFQDGANGIVQEGKACIKVNGQRIALAQDLTTEEGKIISGEDSIQVDEGEAFVLIGSNVFVGKQVRFSSIKQTAFNLYFLVRNSSTGEHIAGADYVIKTASNELIHGLSNYKGHTNTAFAEQNEKIQVYFYPQLEIVI